MTVLKDRPRRARTEFDDWWGSHPAERIRFLIDRFPDGLRGLAHAAGMSHKTLHDMSGGVGNISAAHMTQLARAYGGVDLKWATQGVGFPFGPRPDPGLTARLNAVLQQSYGGETPRMAGACNVRPAELRAFLEGRDVPPDDVVTRVAAHAGVSESWLRDGDGAASHSAEAPAALLLPSLQVSDEFLATLCAMLQRLASWEPRLSQLEAGLAAAETARGDFAKANVAQISQLRTQVDGICSLNVKERIRKVEGDVERVVGEAKGAALSVASTVAANALAVAEAALAVAKDVDNKVARLALGLEEGKEGLRMSDTQTVAAIAALTASMGEVKTMLAGLPEALAQAVDARLARVQKLSAPAQKPAAKAAKEEDIPADSWMSVSAWAAIPGTHQRFTDDKAARSAFGHRMAGLYRRVGLPVGKGQTFMVRDLRILAAWLAYTEPQVASGFRTGPAQLVQFWNKATNVSALKLVAAEDDGATDVVLAEEQPAPAAEPALVDGTQG